MLMAFNYHKSPRRHAVLLFPLYRWEDQASEILRDLLTVNIDVQQQVGFLNPPWFPALRLGDESDRDKHRAGRPGHRS